MRLFQRGQTSTEPFESQQERLARLSGEMLTRYRKELKAEITNPKRVAEVYGNEFASAGIRKQALSVATMASSMLKVPSAMVNVLNGDEQETIAKVGAEAVPTVIDRAESFCQHVIGTGREFAVEDSGEHPLVCDSRYARGGEVVSYLGVPIESHGYIVGVLCVADGTPRQWSTADVGILTQLAAVLTRALTHASEAGETPVTTGPPIVKHG